jgi:hypothetical protein
MRVLLLAWRQPPSHCILIYEREIEREREKERERERERTLWCLFLKLWLMHERKERKHSQVKVKCESMAGNL